MLGRKKNPTANGRQQEASNVRTNVTYFSDFTWFHLSDDYYDQYVMLGVQHILGLGFLDSKLSQEYTLIMGLNYSV